MGHLREVNQKLQNAISASSNQLDDLSRQIRVSKQAERDTRQEATLLKMDRDRIQTELTRYRR